VQQLYKCPNCGAAVSFGTKFCSNCGTQFNWPAQQSQPPMQYYCPNCNAPISFGSNVCQNCGIALSWQDQQETKLSSSDRRDRPPRPESSPTVKFLKWAGISILSFLLFLSLFLFGPAFMFKQTALNPEFVTSEVNRLELAALANEFITEQTSEDFPEEVADAVSTSINKLEPQLKEELNTVIHSVYDYLLGKRDSPDLAILVRNTFFNSDFLGAIIDEVDIVYLVKPILHEQVSHWVPAELDFLNPYIYPAVDELVSNQEPWIKQQLKANIDQIADYLMGMRSDFTVDIPTEPVVTDLRESLLEDIESLPIPQLAGVPPALIEIIFNELFGEFSQFIPASIAIDETVIGTDIPEQISEFITEAEDSLGQMREYISNFQLWYNLLIVFMVLLVIGIILIYREVRGSTRTLGIIFLFFGIIELTSRIVANNIASEQIEQLTNEVPAQLQQWLLQFVNNISAPLQILSIGFIIGGIVLIVISLVYRPRYQMR